MQVFPDLPDYGHGRSPAPLRTDANSPSQDAPPAPEHTARFAMPSAAIAATDSLKLQVDTPPGRIRASVVCRRGIAQDGVIEEMSPIDLRLFVRNPVAVGTLVTVRLSPENWDCHYDVVGIVHRCERLAMGVDLGLFLDQPMSDELIAACWLEMRRELRYPVIWSIWARSHTHGKIIAATIQNYSFSGLQLRMPHAARPGEEITLVADEPLASATVRWSAAVNGHEFVYGCQMNRGDGARLALRLQPGRP
ncbi:MAG: PilZ domain-containing protein [Planctomyces sp.]|nr:PilZ domain-containing protein [Planctomyces sp.]